MKMKPTFFATCASLVLAFATTANADVKEAARQLHEDSNASLVGIKGLVKIDLTMNGQPGSSQELPVWGNGMIIGEGLALTAYSTLVPDIAAGAPGGELPPGVEVKTRLNEVKFVDASGEEYDAKLILHDVDLDLAFLAIDPLSDNAEVWEVGVIDISSDPEAQLLDDVITMSRRSATLRFTCSLKVGSVSAVLKRPRVMYAVDGITPGRPAFTADGTFLGMVTLRKSADKKQSVPVVLPAKYLRKLVPQAMEKQEALKDAPAETEGDSPEEEGGDVEETKEPEEGGEKPKEDPEEPAEPADPAEPSDE